jgi:hypothetical protein
MCLSPLDQTSNANSELKPLVREEDVISQRCRRERFHILKSVQNKANAFLWAYFTPKLVVRFSAFGTTTPIVRAETCISSSYKDLC